MNRLKIISQQLLAQRNERGFWDGQLSSSALGVAVSIVAFHFSDALKYENEIKRAIQWLVRNQNADGGFGDSPESLSNISTSLLAYSALYVTKNEGQVSSPTIEALSMYLKQAGIDVQSTEMAQHVLEFYQKDFTFSVPILTTCALCGIPESDAFDRIPQLPFELALMPRKVYRLLNLNVVSYAIPALVAVGIVIFKHKKSGRFMKFLRRRSVPKAMSLLEGILPESGGFLEAIPLTAFVVMSLVRSSFCDHVVVRKGLDFLQRTQRSDGSWPIDIDLSTWVSTLATKAYRERLDEFWDEDSKMKLTHHLLNIQNHSIHPFNGTGAGGWGWTHYLGSVPDGDDTPGVLLTLLQLNSNPSIQVVQSILAGCDWLLNLQNSDGGFPTFSRGWGKLPFDQSCADLTGHALLALAEVLQKLGNDVPPVKRFKYQRSVEKAIQYLCKHQLENGSWLPLWFGNQYQSKHQNPVYGTARVTAYLNDVLGCGWISDAFRNQLESRVHKAQAFLVSVQNADGSWGGDLNLNGTIEETALAVSALSNNVDMKNVAQQGLQWIDEQSIPFEAAPIGLYFASLWYSEKMYPQVMALEAYVRMSNNPTFEHST
jgi:prenyltransferase beta subunit